MSDRHGSTTLRVVRASGVAATSPSRSGGDAPQKRRRPVPARAVGDGLADVPLLTDSSAAPNAGRQCPYRARQDCAADFASYLLESAQRPADEDWSGSPEMSSVCSVST